MEVDSGKVIVNIEMHADPRRRRPLGASSRPVTILVDSEPAAASLADASHQDRLACMRTLESAATRPPVATRASPKQRQPFSAPSVAHRPTTPGALQGRNFRRAPPRRYTPDRAATPA
ncbi:hypothetical protein J5N97_003112 [Dioscorea zingiberensis]|uniref:Uncharacterized protein n=1 Tax=Dioscorea zingiberensis TaxID=325984 RepID=A0A9D5D3L6_9LILI|nr:hypothetical protein J5N97_003112 [Dioscorea zingiberensis]